MKRVVNHEAWKCIVELLQCTPFPPFLVQALAWKLRWSFCVKCNFPSIHLIKFRIAYICSTADINCVTPTPDNGHSHCITGLSQKDQEGNIIIIVITYAVTLLLWLLTYKKLRIYLKVKINLILYELNYLWIWLWSMTRCKSIWHYHELFWIPLILHYRYASGIHIWMSCDAFVAPPSRQCWSIAVGDSWTGKSIVQFWSTIEPLFEAPNVHCGISNKCRYFGTSNWKNELL